MIDLTCSQCGQSFEAPTSLPGRPIDCPQCGEPIRIPGDPNPEPPAPPNDPPPIPEPTDADGTVIRVFCDCGESFDVPVEYCGHYASCPECRKFLEVGGDAPPDPPASLPPGNGLLICATFLLIIGAGSWLVSLVSMTGREPYVTSALMGAICLAGGLTVAIGVNIHRELHHLRRDLHDRNIPADPDRREPNR